MSQSPAGAARVVLITGASSGIGKACAFHMAARGWHVFGTSRMPVPAEGRPFEMIAMDVDDEESVRRGVAEMLGKVPRIDAVVNNAGFAMMGAVEDTSIAEAKAQLETNFFGVLRVCRAVLPTMRRQGHGAIINISSLSGIQGLPFSGLYTASKFALEGVTESLRLETMRFGIRVTLVEPGDFRTEMPIRRRVAAAAETHNAYAKEFSRFKTKQDQDEAGADEPHAVARLVERLCCHPRPKTRYSVGMLSQRIVVPLKRFLPQRAYEWLLCKVIGL